MHTQPGRSLRHGAWPAAILAGPSSERDDPQWTLHMGETGAARSKRIYRGGESSGSGGWRRRRRREREVHGAPRAPRFAWPRSSVSRAKAAGAPPHWTNCATFMLLGSFSLYFTTRQSSIFFPRSPRPFWRTLNTRVEINDSFFVRLFRGLRLSLRLVWRGIRWKLTRRYVECTILFRFYLQISWRQIYAKDLEVN